MSTGTTTGIALLTTHIAFATYIFSGSLSPHVSKGVGLILFGGCAACLFTALTSGYRGNIAGVAPASVVAMAVIASTMQASDSALFASVVVTFMLCALCIGILCLVLGRFGLANLLRFIPYPVAAGFISGIGGTVILAAMTLMVDDFHWDTLPSLLEIDTLWRWLPGIAFGGILYWMMKRWSNPLILPISVSIAVCAFHVTLLVFDTSMETARTSGLLLTEVARANQWPALGFNDLMTVDWTAIALQFPNILVLCAIAVISIVMNIAGLEVAIKQDLDWNREFKASGTASSIAGLGGGTVASTVPSAAVRNKLFGADTRLSGIFAASVLALALFFGGRMLEFVPTFLIGGVLVFAGLSLLDQGIVKGFRQLPVIDLAIIVLIFVTILGFGLLEGLGVGLLAILVSYAVRLSRVDPIESHKLGGDVRSNKARSVPDRVILQEEGTRLSIYRLQGYIFFGSVSQLASRLRELIQSDDPPICLMLDFTAVSGIDYSAVHVLSRLLEAAHRSGVRVAICAVPDHVLNLVERNLPDAVFTNLIVEDNEDRALERSEDILIASWRANEDATQDQRSQLLRRTASRIEQQLERQIEFEGLVEELEGWLESREYAVGDALFSIAARRDELQLLTEGQASSYDSSGHRIQQFCAGDSIEPLLGREQGVYSVVADQPSKTLVVSPLNRDRIEENQPELALRLYRYLLPDWTRSVHKEEES